MAENGQVQTEQECGQFPKNATSVVVGRLVVVHGIACADLRVFVASADGEAVPTRAGICLARGKLPELAALIQDMIEASDETGKE